MNQSPIATQRKPSELDVAWRAKMKPPPSVGAMFWFWMLYLSAMVVALTVSCVTISSAVDLNAWRDVSIEMHWLRHFSDMPGVRGYAQELLKQDYPPLLRRLAATTIFFIIPALLVPGILIVCAAKCIRNEIINFRLHPVVPWLLFIPLLSYAAATNLDWLIVR